MLTKTDLERLAQVRLDDSLFLLQAGRSSSAYYLAGYSVELALKACISKLIQPNVIPEKAFINAIYTHRLENLLSTAGLLPDFNADAKADAQFAAYCVFRTIVTGRSGNVTADSGIVTTRSGIVTEDSLEGFEGCV